MISETQTKSSPSLQKKSPLFSFIVAYFCPTILTKISILYFGLNYSYYPGDGYGYGLAASLIFTVVMLTRFVIKFWNIEEL